MRRAPGVRLVIGYSPSSVAAGAVGALLLGYYDGGKLMYAGRVGTGWSGAEAAALKQALEKIAGDKPAFGKPLPAGADIKGVRWAEPRPRRRRSTAAGPRTG